MVPLDKLRMEHAEQLRRLQYDEVSPFEKLRAAQTWLATLDQQMKLRPAPVSAVPVLHPEWNALLAMAVEVESIKMVSKKLHGICSVRRCYAIAGRRVPT